MNAVPATEAISLPESKRLVALEETIQSGLAKFVEVGNALAEIRESRLYRLEFSTFEDYCRNKWKISKTQAGRLIDSAVVAGNVTPMGVIPECERQLRPLAKLESADRQREAWSEAVAVSGGNPTGRHVAAAVEKQLSTGEGAATIIPFNANAPSRGMAVVDEVIRVLERRIKYTDTERRGALGRLRDWIDYQLKQ